MSSTTPPAPRVNIGTPKSPDLNLYAHLNQKERMIAGWPYLPADEQLTKDRAKAHKLCKQFNTTEVDEFAGRREILKDLLHPDSKDKWTWIEPDLRVDYGYNFKVGNNFQANYNCVVLDSALIEIGDNCLLAPGVHIYSATHPLDPEHRKDGPNYYELAAPVKIGHQCWVGGQSIICPGVTIGDNVVIGAGSVVTKDIPSNVVVAGNPAKIIRYLDGADIPQGVEPRADK